jgi:hypothetical protein
VLSQFSSTSTVSPNLFGLTRPSDNHRRFGVFSTAFLLLSQRNAHSALEFHHNPYRPARILRRRYKWLCSSSLRPATFLNCLLVTLLILSASTHCCLTAATLAMGISKPYDPYRHTVTYYLAVRKSEMLYFTSLNHGFVAVLIFAPHRAPLLRPVHTAR